MRPSRALDEPVFGVLRRLAAVGAGGVEAARRLRPQSFGSLEGSAAVEAEAVQEDVVASADARFPLERFPAAGGAAVAMILGRFPIVDLLRQP